MHSSYRNENKLILIILYVYVSGKRSIIQCDRKNSVGSPATKKCIKAYRQKRKSHCASNQTAKVRCLSKLDVAEFMVKNSIKSDDELFTAAYEKKSAGQKQLANLILNQSPKNLQDLISNTWKMQQAVANLQEKNVPRMDVIRRYSTTECVDGFNGTWLQCTMQVLTQNNVNPVVFANALREQLEKGRG